MRGDCRATLLFLLCLCTFRDALGDCNRGSADECRDAEFVPGASLVGEGYDVVTLQNKGAFVIDVNSWHNPDGTCTLCRNQLLSNVRQRLPLSLVDWRVQQSCKRSLSSRLFRSAAELGKSATSTISNDWSVDLQVTPKPGVNTNLMLAGSKSKVMAFGATRTKSDHYSFTSHGFHCRYYRCRVKDQPLLSPQFALSLASLPNISHEGTQYHYQKLVSNYGTHFIKSVELGGRFRDVTAIRTCEAASQGYTSEEVKDCLEVEAGAQVGIIAKGSARYKQCQEMARSMKHHDNFHQAFSDRDTDVTGGDARQGVDLFFSDDGTAFTRWADSLPRNPGMVRYALEPLHHLLPRNDPRHANLRRYISDYIKENALAQRCSGGSECPAGSQRDPSDPCSCQCREDARVTRQCCSTGKGIGRLAVRVKRGHDLWGDYFGGTDGYVVVKLGEAKSTSPVRPHTNNPVWNTDLELGVVKAESGHKLTIEIWDQDNGYDDDLLGSCKVSLTSGTHQDVCYLRYGSVSYDYTFTCGPHLGGHTCQDYVAHSDNPPFTSFLGARRRRPPSGDHLSAVVFP
ncbi:perforin-1-like [Mustelus asterias]